MIRKLAAAMALATLLTVTAAATPAHAAGPHKQVIHFGSTNPRIGMGHDPFCVPFITC